MSGSETDPHERQFYTVPEAARMLHVRPTTVRRWIAAGKLLAQRVGPGNIRVWQHDLEGVVTLVQAKNSTAQKGKPSPAVAQEELTSRQALAAQILAKRKGRVIAPLTTVDLLRKAREGRARFRGR